MGTAIVDPEGMREHVLAFPQAWNKAYALGQKAKPTPPKPLRDVVVVGMGGSGITGDVLTSALASHPSLRVRVVKDSRLPAWVGPDTWVWAISYSGNTRETLYDVGHARKAGAPVLAITSGGTLQEAAKANGWQSVLVPDGLPPRAAFPWLAGTALGLAEALGWSSKQPDTQHLRRQADAGARKKAATWAKTLAEGVPVAYGWGPMGVAALRCKCQLNENAKHFARAEVVPEALHNDIVPWGEARERESHRAIFFRTPAEPAPIQARFAYAEQVMGGDRPPLQFRPHTHDALGGMIEGVLFSDLLSLEVAAVRGVDPTPVQPIDELKRQLAGPDDEALAYMLGL